MKSFKPLNITTKFFKYSLPLNLDSYRYCSFQCKYCFMKNRVVGKRDEYLKADVDWLKRKFEKVYDEHDIDSTNFMDMLLKNRISINCGTKSEPFQPIEKTEQTTKKIIDICNEYDQKIIFGTKSDTYYDVNCTPDNHSFQLSITNDYSDRFLEPYAPSFENKVKFFNQLKDEGFKVGIRFEPFIPNVTDMMKCLTYFEDVDHVHISRLRLLPQINNDEIMKYIHCSESDFVNTGLKVLKADVWYGLVKPTIDYLEENGYSYSTSFIHIGNSDCLGGDVLAWNYTHFDSYHLLRKYGDNWTLEDGLNEIGEYRDCICNYLWTSNRQNGCKTVEEFYINKWDSPRCKFNPNNQFRPPSTTLTDYIDFKNGKLLKNN